jgi:ubiquitin-protein ligase E3 C
MFNFTGSGRRPRNVNLSGKKSTSTPGLSSLRNKPTPSSSLQAARDERAAREAERRRLKAAGAIQRTWRGRKVAEDQRDVWRATLDQAMSTDIDLAPNLMSLFLGFASMGRQKPRRQWSQQDLERLDKMLVVTRMWLLGKEKNPDPKRNRYLRRKFGKLLVSAIDCGVAQNEALETVLQSLAQLVRHAPEIANEEYYTALSKVTVSATLNDTLLYALVEALTNPLQRPKDGESKSEADLDTAYRAFDTRYLTTPNLVSRLGDRATKKLMADIDLQKAASCCSMDLETESKLWLLSHIIYFTRHGKQVVDLTGDVSPKLSAVKEEYINFVSRVLSSVAVEVGQRIDVEDYVMEEPEEEADSDDEAPKPSKQLTKTKKEPLPVFVKQQIESLVQQSTITSLLSSTKSTDGNVQVLAGFALTLLLVFPAKRTDMRFWLCVALTSDGVPAVKYVWNAVKKCQLFASIKGDSFAAIDPLKYPPVTRAGISAKSVEEQWNLIFLFLEMYSFVLVTGDDHEFLQGKGRQLALSEVSQLTLFLKNLAFAMYWWFGEIMGEDKTKDNSAEVYFRVQENGRAWELSYFRSVVTDVLKAIYTREWVTPP